MLPEEDFWRGVLFQALRDLVAVNVHVTIKREVRAWLFSPRSDLGSFVFICDVLGLDPSYMRSRVSLPDRPNFRSHLKVGTNAGRRPRRSAPAFPADRSTGREPVTPGAVAS